MSSDPSRTHSERSPQVGNLDQRNVDNGMRDPMGDDGETRQQTPSSPKRQLEFFIPPATDFEQYTKQLLINTSEIEKHINKQCAARKVQENHLPELVLPSGDGPQHQLFPEKDCAWQSLQATKDTILESCALHSNWRSMSDSIIGLPRTSRADANIIVEECGDIRDIAARISIEYLGEVQSQISMLHPRDRQQAAALKLMLDQLRQQYTQFFPNISREHFMEKPSQREFSSLKWDSANSVKSWQQLLHPRIVKINHYLQSLQRVLQRA